jgi:hypothetical protein
MKTVTRVEVSTKKAECGHFKSVLTLIFDDGNTAKVLTPLCFDSEELAKDAGLEMAKGIPVNVMEMGEIPPSFTLH